MDRINKHLLLALCALLALNNAWGCSCKRLYNGGFIHANLARLPANARGALFQLPETSPPTLTPKSFTITSDGRQQRLAARLTWLDVAIATDGRRRLVRVAPASGFQPGVRYTIVYHGKTESWTFPAKTSFVIDREPLAAGAYRIALTSAPAGRMLEVPDGAACHAKAPSVVAQFQYQLPPQHLPYRSAMLYASQTRTGPGAFAPLGYAADYCSAPQPGATALPDGRELVHASCRGAPQRIAVRGRAGLLEVEDALQSTNLIAMDFGIVARDGCDLFDFFRAAHASGDAQRIEDVLCAIGPNAYPGGGTTKAPAPPLQTVVSLARSSQPPPRACLYEAAVTIIAASGVSPQALDPLLAEDLASNDTERVALAQRTQHLIHTMKHSSSTKK
jgi:hypothetical protein